MTCDNSLASMAGTNSKTLATAITLLIALGIELANKYGPFWTFRFIAGGLGYSQASPYEIRKAQKAAEKARKAREAEEAEERRREAEEREKERQRLAEARFAQELEARAAADAEEKAKAARKAKRSEAETREKGDPETVKSWVNSKRVILGPSHVISQTEAYADYAADCRAHGQAPVTKGRWFADELRKLGLEVRETKPGSKRFDIYGLALSRVDRPALRVVSSR